MAKKSGLGKGFGSLLPDDFDKSVLLDKKDRIEKINVSDITANPEQPRKHFDEEGIKELSRSIKQHGILQPLVVTPSGDEYIIVAGERRFRAAVKAGLKQVPCLVRSTAELERLEIGLVENVQRVDLSPLEQAASIAKLHEQFNMSFEEIGVRLGKASTTVINIVRLLQLPEKAREALRKGIISEGHARTVLTLKDDPKAQDELVDSIHKLQWSVRRAEKFVSDYRKGHTEQDAKAKRAVDSITVHPKLTDRFKSPVTIKHGTRGGVLQIKFASNKELKRITKQLLN